MLHSHDITVQLLAEWHIVQFALTQFCLIKAEFVTFRLRSQGCTHTMHLAIRVFPQVSKIFHPNLSNTFVYLWNHWSLSSCIPNYSGHKISFLSSQAIENIFVNLCNAKHFHYPSAHFFPHQYQESTQRACFNLCGNVSVCNTGLKTADLCYPINRDSGFAP